MLIRRRRGWELPESAATPEAVFRDRRRLIKGIGAGALLAGASPWLFGRGAAAAGGDPSAGLYPVARNERYTFEGAITPQEITSTYNNFFEFGSSKRIAEAAQELKIRPWTVTLDGMVEKERRSRSTISSSRCRSRSVSFAIAASRPGR